MAFRQRRIRPIGPSLAGVGQAQQPTPATAPIPTTPPIGGVRTDTGFGGRPEGAEFTRPSAAPLGAADQAGDMMPIGGTPSDAPADSPIARTAPTVGELVGTFQEQAEEAKAANLARYEQGLGIHEQLVGDFGQGGTMEAAAMQRYERQKQRDLATQTQQMVSSGLYGTTMPSTQAATYEEQVGTPYKLGLAESMAQRKAEAMRGQAGFIERREDTPPDPALMAGLVERASARPEEDAAAVGAAPEATSIWGSGQTGAVTAAQFSAEAQRQQYNTAYSAQVPAYESQIKAYKDVAKKFDPGSPQQAHYANLIKHYDGLLKTAKENVEKYSEEKAGISSVQYAEEQQRQQSLARTAETQRQAAARTAPKIGRMTAYGPSHDRLGNPITRRIL